MLEEYFIVIFRTILLYVLITIIYRIMGKREIGELSILDLVISIMIAELAVVAIEKSDEKLFRNILPMLILMVVQIVSAYWSLKSKKIRDLVDGKPVILINKGKIDEKAMKKLRYNLDDLLMQLREKDISLISDVEYAILEVSGSLSVIEKSNQSSQADLTPSFTLPLVLDGRINSENLTLINKDELWLKKELKEKGVHDISRVSLCSFENNTFYIDLIDEK
uniref:DUF421 domain-containing protein n=1 Tax=Cytobacillus kochii TaxID=859143 RepID=UPI0027B8B919|nr:DUF421 domain-containing protein [Cytobacillus kochii]